MAAPAGLIVGWPLATAIPAGWSRLTAGDDRFPRPWNTAGFGGSATHTHTVDPHFHTDYHEHSGTTGSTGATASQITAGGGQSVLTVSHTHTTQTSYAAGLNSSTASLTSNAASNNYPTYTVRWIKADGSTDIPTGALAWNSQPTVPEGWQAHAASINAFLIGAAAAANGGTFTAETTHAHTATHNHTMSTASHTHPFTAATSSFSNNQNIANTGAGRTVISSSHTHLPTGSTGAASHVGNATGTDPLNSSAAQAVLPWMKLQHIEAMATAPAPGGIIGCLEHTTVPTGWALCNGAKGTPNINGTSTWIKGANGSVEVGTTGGAAHAHSGLSHSHSIGAAGGTAHGAGSVAVPASASTTKTITASTTAATLYNHTHTAPASFATDAPTFPVQGGTSDYQAAVGLPPYLNLQFIMAEGPGLAFPATTILDDFNAANTTDINGRVASSGRTWTAPMPGIADYDPALNPLGINSNQLYKPSAGGSATVSGILSGAESRANAPVEWYCTISGAFAPQLSVAWLISTPGVGTTTGYLAGFNASVFNIFRWAPDASFPSVGGISGLSLGVGDKVGIRHYPDGTIRVYADKGSGFVQIGQFFDNTYSSGQFAVLNSGTSALDDLGGQRGTPAAGPTSALIDDFTGANTGDINGRAATPSGRTWSTPMPGATDIIAPQEPLGITSNRLIGTDGVTSNWSSGLLNGLNNRTSAPVEVYCTIGPAPFGQLNFWWLITTPGVGTTNGYLLAWNANTINVIRVDSGALTVLQFNPGTYNPGDKVGIRHDPDGTIHTLVSKGGGVWFEVGSVVDNTYFTGQVGAANVGLSTMDDFGGTASGNIHTGAASLAGTSVLTGTGTVTRLAAASLAGTSAIAATGQREVMAAAALAGVGLLGATGTYTQAAAAGITGLGAVAATGTQNTVGFAVASLAGIGLVAATGTLVAATGRATILGTSSLAGVNSTVTRHGAAGLAGAGAVAATGGYLRLGAAGLLGTSSLTATPRKDVPGAASLAGQGALNASGLLIHTATAQLTGTGLVSATGREIFAARVTVTGQGTLGLTAVVDSLAYASIHGVGTLIATALVIRPQAPMRIRLEVRDPAGNLLNAGPFLEALQASYEQALDQVGSFEVTIPATSRRAAMFTHANQVDIYREGEGLVFRGIIEHLRQEGGPDNEPTILVSGGSTARKGLVHLKTGRDRNFSGATLASIVGTLLSGSGYTAGTVDVPAVLATMTTTASRWAALVRAAELFGIHAREDVLASQVDVSAFGTVRSLRLVTATGVSPSLLDSPNVAVIASVDVEEDSSEIANKLYGLGGGEGVNVLHLGYGDRASPYAIQSEAGPTYTEYFLRDATSATAYGERQKYVSVADLMPLANSSAGFLAAANSLYDILVDEMLRWKDPLREYEVGVADLKHLDAAGAYRFEVGDKLPVWARGMVRRSDGTAAWLDLDTSLWVTAYRRTFTATGADNWQLTLANVNRHGQDLSQKISEVISDVEALKVAHKPYTYDRSAGPYRNSVDASNALPFSILFDANTYLIHKSNLTFRVRGVRSNSTTASSGGSATSGSGSSHTHTITATSSGAGTTHSHSLAGATTNPSGDFVAANWVITSTAPAGLTGIDDGFVAGHKHNVVATNRQLSLDTHTHTFSGAVAANEASHTHSVGGGTSGADASHTHTTPNHTHPLTYGIFEATTPASPAVGITINGVSRTVALGGPWNSGVTLDITQYLQGANGQPLRQENAIILSAGVLCDIEVEVHTLATATSLIPV